MVWPDLQNDFPSPSPADPVQALFWTLPSDTQKRGQRGGKRSDQTTTLTLFFFCFLYVRVFIYKVTNPWRRAYDTCITMGPATMSSSVSLPSSGPAFARLTYVTPARFWGTTQPAAWSKGEKTVPPGMPPVVKAQCVAPAAASLWSWTVAPAATAVALAPAAMERVGKAVRIRFEPSGQLVMKGAASEKTCLGDRGVSKAWGTAMPLLAGADEGLVAGLDREDGAGGGQDRAVRNKGSGAKVGRHADVLEDGGGADHAGGGGEAEL